MKKSSTGRKKGIIIKAIGTVLAMPFVIILITMALLYIPQVQRHAVNKCSEFISSHSNYELHMEKFNLHFPLNLTIKNFILSQESDTLLQGERLRVSISLLPLLKGEIEANYISIDNTTGDTFALIDGTRISGSIGHFRTAIRNADIADGSIKINQLNLTDSNIELTFSDRKKEKEESDSSAMDWKISLIKGKLANVGVNIKLPEDTITIATHIGITQVRDLTIEPGKKSYRLERFTLDDSKAAYDRGTQPDSIAPTNHLRFGEIALHLHEAEYSPQKINARIEKIAMRQEPSGLTIEQGNLQMTNDSVNISINDIHIASRNGTLLDADVTIPRQINEGKSSANIKSSLHINKRDLSGFLTKEKYRSLDIFPDSLLNLNAKIHGNTKKVTIDTINAQIPGIARIALSGKGTNLTDKKRRGFNLLFNVAARHPQRATRATLPDSIIRNGVKISGEASLANSIYAARTTIITRNGTAQADGTYSTTADSYNAKVQFDKFNLSALLPGVPLHLLSMNATLTGTGTDIYSDSTHYICAARIDTLQYDTHTFDNIQLNAMQDTSTSHIKIASESPMLQMLLSATTRIRKSVIRNHTEIELQHADIQKLGLSQQPLSASMKLKTYLTTDLNENYSIRARGEELEFHHRGHKYTPAEVRLAALTKKDSTLLRITSGDLNIDGYIAAGYKATLESIEKVKTLALSRFNAHDTLPDIREYERLLPLTNIRVNAKNKNILADYLAINGITYDEASLVCRIDSLKEIEARGSILNLEHNKQHLDTLRFALSQDSTQLKYFTGVKSRSTLDEKDKSTFGAALYGTLDRGTLTANYIFRDRNDAIGMRVGASARMANDGYLISFSPTATLFGHPFTFNKDNGIFVSHESKIRGNIELRDTTNSGMNLYAHCDSAQHQDISMELLNIDLQTVTKILPFAPDLAGIMNIDVHYKESNRGILFGSDASVENLIYEGTHIGNERLELSYFPRNGKEHLAYLTMLHNNRKVALFEGKLDKDTLDGEAKGELTLTRFPLNMANAFLKNGNISADGYIDGAMTIDMAGKSPIANGYLKFDSAYADLPQFGTTLHLVEDKVNLEENILKFDNFRIYAKGSTPFKMNGTVNLNNPLNPDFNLRMRADNYEIVNAKRTKNSILYGRMFINLNSRITGSLNTLKINGSTTVLGKSDVTYVIQDTPLETENSLDGLVTFTNFEDTTIVENETPEYDLGDIELNITLAIEEGARINADFDSERTSYIELQGEGNLNLTYTGETGMNLTGRYQLSNGEMKYTLPVIPLKTFNISSGSYLNWTGDIANPTLNITAVERVITSAVVDDNSQAVQFDVGVKLTNTLNNMGLSFTLSAPENAAVQNQLNGVDAETLNKYALTMLITGAYIGGDNNLSVSSALSSFLDTQINNLVGNAMNSTMDINVGITDLEDATTGDTYKNYSFSFTKRFWNDRLKVVIGGEVNNNATTNESFINNVSLEWKISNSGNRYLRLFYDKNYESILEGEITETGIGYVYRRKLNSLNELLIFNRKANNQPAIPTRRTEQRAGTTNEEKEHKQ